MAKLVPILLGSESDKGFAEKITSELKNWGIPYEIKVVSAHKVPEKLFALVNEYNRFEGDLVYVTIAGRSNGLSGCTAGSSIHPVIACPPFADKDDMTVNINSTLQMPSDTPVMTVLDPKNVVLAIVRIFSLKDAGLKNKYLEHLEKVKSSFNL